MNDTPRRKLSPRPLARPPAPATPVIPERRTSWRLPTIAAVVSALAMSTISSRASADEVAWFDDDAGPVPIASADGGDAATSADADPDADAGPVYCVPDPDGRTLGGVPAMPRVHGSGCGCSGGDQDDEPMQAVAAVTFLLLLFRRKRPLSGLGDDPGNAL